jgi:hypothetical protein
VTTRRTSPQSGLTAATGRRERPTPVRRGRLRNLGHGAFYSPVKGDKNDATLLFKRGAYTVLIDPTRIGGRSSNYPTEAQYVKLARAIYKHLA